MALRHPAKRKTLGLQGTVLSTFMQNQMWRGAMKAAQEGEANLIYYPTISLDYTLPFDPQTKVLFDLVDAQYVDGLLVWYAGIAEGVGIAEAKHFFDRYQGLPLVTVGGQLQNYPDLSIDNYQGVREAIEHLIQVHHYQHIAIIRGPSGHPDADERYQAYVETLQAHGIPFNPDYVAEVLFEFVSDAANTRLENVLTRWLVDLNLKIDAVVAASDYIALATVRAIQGRGLRVPEDIAVVGFDDVIDSQASIPALTTVQQPFYDLGYQATRMLLASIDGASLPPHSIMPAPLVVRESCGCLAKSLSLASSSLVDVSPIPERNTQEAFISITRDLGIPLEQVEKIVEDFQSDLHAGSSQHFLFSLRQQLIAAMKSSFHATAWQNAISVLRGYILATNGEIGTWGEALFNQARVLVTEVAQRAYIKEQLKAERQVENLRRTSEALITAFGKELLTDTLNKRLPELGFPSFYLSLYANPHQPATWSYLILANHHKQRLPLPPEGLRFPTGSLIPEALLPLPPTAHFVVEPLYFRDERLGLLVLEVGTTEGEVYEHLRAQISSALQGSKLLLQVQQHASQLEQRVAERTTELTQTVELLRIKIAERRQAEEELRHNEEMAREFQEKLKALQEVSLELMAAPSIEALCLKAIELGHHTLGYDRLGLLIFETMDQPEVLKFGINSRGEIYTERGGYNNKHDQSINELVTSPNVILVNEDTDLRDADNKVVGQGWNVMSGLWDGKLSIGWLAADNFLGRNPLIPYQVELLRLYSLTLGHLITLKRAEEALRGSEKVAREFQERLRALHEISLELSALPSLDRFFYKAVELGTQRLGIERCGLLLIDDDHHLIGTYGTDETGNIRDERDLKVKLAEDSREAQLVKRGVGVDFWEDADLYGAGKIVGRGWSALAVLWNGSKGIGLVATDNYLTQRPPRPYMVDLLGLYGNLLGNLLSQKQAEVILQQSEERFRAIAEASPIAIIISQRLPEGRLLYANPSSVDLYGYAPAVMNTLTLYDLYYNVADHKTLAAALRQRGRLKNYDLQGKKADGSLIWQSVTLVPIKYGGEAALIIAALDITDRKQLELAIRTLNTELEQKVVERTAQLEMVNKELEAFAYSVSHDLRAPLRGMDGFSQALLEDYEATLDATGQSYLKRIRAAAQRMGNMIDALLTLSRITRSQLNLQPVDLSSLASEIITTLKEDQPERRVEVHIAPAVQGLCDPRLVQIALQNLFQNAWKYTGKQAIAYIEFGCREIEDELVYFIADNGIGFDMAYADKLFGAFQRLHTDQEFEGTGIGLATVQRVIHRHGGRIWAEAQPAKGATFYFTLIPESMHHEE